MRAPFQHSTPQQLRAFRLLTLAQLVYLESIGLGIGAPPTARRAAIQALSLTHMDGAAGISTNEIIAALRKAATEAIGADPKNAEPPSKPYLPADWEATT